MDLMVRMSQYGNLFDNWQVQQLLTNGGYAKCWEFQLARQGASGREHCRMYAACIVQRNISWYRLSEQQQRLQYQSSELEIQAAIDKLQQQHLLPGGEPISGSFEHCVKFWADEESFGWDLLVRQIASISPTYVHLPAQEKTEQLAWALDRQGVMHMGEIHPMQQRGINQTSQENPSSQEIRAQQVLQASRQTPPEQSTGQKKRKRKLAWVVGVAAVMLVVCAGALLFLLKDRLAPKQNGSDAADVSMNGAGASGVYWTRTADIYHTHEDCVNLGSAYQFGTVEDAFVQGCTSVCHVCAERDGFTTPNGNTAGESSDATLNSVPTTPVTTEPPAKQLEYRSGTELRMATGYNNAKTGLFFDAATAGEGVTLADGKTYHTDDLKPTWVEMQDRLGIRFENYYMGNYSTKEFQYWQDRLCEVDMVSISLSQSKEAGLNGQLVNLADYLDYMPNFKAFLDANPVVRLSITADMATGAIYVSPYFDGVSDVERVPLMRTDWVEKLLNGEGRFEASKSNKLSSPVYTPYMPTSGKIAVDVVEADGMMVRTITKDYDVYGNIIDRMNAAGRISGEDAVNMLRDYIDYTYNGYYGINRADLFIGQNAAWDADELVALLRCVVANPQTLNGTDNVEGLFSREDSNNQRRVDMYRLAGMLFGVRGLDSRLDWLYCDMGGTLHDARQEVATYQAMERMHAISQEGLIADSYIHSLSEKMETMLSEDRGFMHYDYSQTQTIYNETKLQDGEEYRAVMIPIARWNDGTGEAYFRFTESWRSVKTDGWAISAAGIAGDEDKLHAALKIIDYAYSYEGMILLSYGPDPFIMYDSRGNYETFNFNGVQWPVIADATHEDIWELCGGNYTNYARQYLGSTLSFVKSQAFEFQCTVPAGQKGMSYISNAIALGVIYHPVLDSAGLNGNMWYASMPTVLPTTTAESMEISSMTDLGNVNFGTSKGNTNIFVDTICYGYTIDGVSSAASAARKVRSEWGGKAYLELRQQAFDRYMNGYWTYCR